MVCELYLIKAVTKKHKQTKNPPPDPKSLLIKSEENSHDPS